MYWKGKLSDRIPVSKPVSTEIFSLFLESLGTEEEALSSYSKFFATDFNLTDRNTQLIRSIIKMRLPNDTETKEGRIKYSKTDYWNDKDNHSFVPTQQSIQLRKKIFLFPFHLLLLS